MMRISILKFAGGCLLLSAVAFSSCKKSVNSRTSTVTDFNNSSVIQVFMAMVNANRNYVYVDAKPINGAPMVSGSIFPSTGYGSSIEGGFKAFLVRDTLGAATQLPLSFAENMQVGKNYTIFVYDTITSPKQKTVETPIIIPSDSTARLRFANFIYAPFATPAVDVFSYVKNANVFTNVNVTDVTAFVSYPTKVPVDTLYIRDAGTTNNLVKVALLNPGLLQKRSYTLVYRGSYRGTRTATLFANR